MVIIHKPPSVTIKSFENVPTEFFQSLKKESPHWFIMGDTNSDMNYEKHLVTFVFYIIYPI